MSKKESRTEESRTDHSPRAKGNLLAYGHDASGAKLSLGCIDSAKHVVIRKLASDRACETGEKGANIRML